MQTLENNERCESFDFLNMFENFINLMESFVLVKDENLNLILANKPAIKELNLPNRPILKKELKGMYPEFISDSDEDDLAALNGKNIQKNTLETFPLFSGKNIPVKLKRRIIADPSNGKKLLVCIYTNRSEYINLENDKKELSKSSNHFSEVSQTKNRFLATVSHEIRTPLNIILGCIDLLSDMSPESTADSLPIYLEKMNSSARHLNNLIEDVLNISLIENNQLKSSPSNFNVQELLEEIVQELSVIGAKIDKKISFNLSLEVSNFVTDKKFLRQIISNLISNSFKYSGVSECELSVNLKDQSLLLVVSDKGVGMSPDDLSRVFEPFYQIKNPDTFSKTGVGLGLSLVNQLISEIGGSIKIDSALNKGTSIRVKLPRLKGSHEARELDFQSIDYKKILKGRRLLIVEDDPDNRFVFGKYFLGSGASVDFAEDGFEGLSKYKNMKSSLDLMLIDLRMPKLTGYELIEKIRKWEAEKGRKSVPALCLSANVSKNDQQKAFESGFHDFAKKPVAKIELLEKAASVILKSLNGELNV